MLCPSAVKLGYVKLGCVSLDMLVMLYRLG